MSAIAHPPSAFASIFPKAKPGSTTPPKRVDAALPSLDVMMENLTAIDREGPFSATTRSPFLASPVIGSTLLMSAGMIANNVHPALQSPTSPIVMHPVSIFQALAAGGTQVAPTKSQVLFEGQIRPTAVAAFEDLLFLMRIAKWKVAYQQGHAFDRQEQLPYCRCSLFLLSRC